MGRRRALAVPPRYLQHPESARWKYEAAAASGTSSLRALGVGKVRARLERARQPLFMRMSSFFGTQRELILIHSYRTKCYLKSRASPGDIFVNQELQ